MGIISRLSGLAAALVLLHHIRPVSAMDAVSCSPPNEYQEAACRTRCNERHQLSVHRRDHCSKRCRSQSPAVAATDAADTSFATTPPSRACMFPTTHRCLQHCRRVGGWLRTAHVAAPAGSFLSSHCQCNCGWSVCHPRRKDDNRAANQLCKATCHQLRERCGTDPGCGPYDIDLHTMCPATCGSPPATASPDASSLLDDNEQVGAWCKVSCKQARKNCGRIIMCGPYRAVNVSAYCPDTCSGGPAIVLPPDGGA